MAYKIYFTRDRIFWTPNSEWKPDYNLLRDLNWEKIDNIKSPISYTSIFTATIVLPKKVNNIGLNTTYIKVEDDQGSITKYYHVDDKQMEMKDGYVYNLILDVWATYCIPLIRNARTPTHKLEGYVERFMNNSLYSKYYLKGRSWIYDDEYFNYERYSYGVGYEFRNYIQGILQNNTSIQQMRVYFNSPFNQTDLRVYTGYQFDTLSFEDVRNSIVVYQLDNGLYYCFLANDDKTINLYMSGNIQNVRGNETLEPASEKTLALKIPNVNNLINTFKNNSQPYNSNNNQRPFIFANKLIGVYKIPPYFLNWHFQTRNFSKYYPYNNNHLYYFRTDVVNGIYGETEQKYRPTDYVINGVFFIITPEEFNYLKGPNFDKDNNAIANVGWYPYLIYSMGSKFDNNVKAKTYDRRTSIYTRNEWNVYVVDNEISIIMPYANDIKCYYTRCYRNQLNKYALGRCKFLNIYLDPSATWKDSNVRLLQTKPNTPVQYFKIRPEGIGFDGVYSFSGYDFWNTNVFSGDNICSSRGTVNTSTSKYGEFILSSYSNMNTGLQIAKDRSQVARLGAIGSIVDTTISSVGYAVNGNQGTLGAIGNIIGGIGGLLGGAIRGSANLKSAENIYKHEQMRMRAELTDARNSSKPQQILPNVKEDDIITKIIKDMSYYPHKIGLQVNNIGPIATYYPSINEIYLSYTGINSASGPNHEWAVSELTKLPSSLNDINYFNRLTWDVGFKGNFYAQYNEIFSDMYHDKYFAFDERIDPLYDFKCWNKFISVKMKIPEEHIRFFLSSVPNLELEVINAVKIIFDSNVKIWDRKPSYTNEDAFVLVDQPILIQGGKDNEPNTETSQKQNEPNNNQSTPRIRRTERKTKKTKRNDNV